MSVAAQTPPTRCNHSDVPVDGFNGSLGGVGGKLATFGGFFWWFAQGLAVEGKAVRSVHEAVEDGICDCRIDDHLVPVIDGELAGHDRGAAAVAIVDDFEQIAALLRGQRRQPPVVEDQKLDTGEALEEAYIPSIAACQRKCVEQAWYAIIEHRTIVTARLVSERAGEPALAGAGFPGDQEVVSPPDGSSMVAFCLRLANLSRVTSRLLSRSTASRSTSRPSRSSNVSEATAGCCRCSSNALGLPTRPRAISRSCVDESMCHSCLFVFTRSFSSRAAACGPPGARDH